MTVKRVHWLLIGLAVAGVAFALSRTRKGQVIIEEIADETGAIVDKVKQAIVREEGERLKVYLDNATPPKWTVGVGHKILSSDTVNRSGVQQKLHPYGPVTEITQAESDAFFKRDTEEATHTVDDAVDVLLSTNQRAALISFVFNIGSTNFRYGGPNGGPSTILAKLNARDFAGAANEFSRWIYSGDKTKPNPVLVARRERERQLFLTA